MKNADVPPWNSRRIVVAYTIAGLLCWAGSVRAETTADDRALATVLFQEGRALMAAGRIPEACQKLEESQRVDPAGGTLLNLALCHEQEGRLAHSWSEFNEAVVVARRDGRRDREIEATNHVRALEPRLSRLTIVVPAGTRADGLRIELDNREIGRGAWSTAIPIDGGDHVVRATATGKDPFVATVPIGKEGDARTIEIPVLATPVVVVTPPRVSSPASEPDPPMTAATTARLRTAGIATAGAGVVALGIAGYALVAALRAQEESNEYCWADGCGDTGLGKRSDAVSRGNVATIFSAGGAVLIGAGATLFYIGRRGAAHVLLGGTPGSVMTGIRGRF